MNLKEEWKKLALIVGGFLACFFLPVGARFNNALMEALQLVRWYAREHVVLCLVPAFFIAGAIAVFVSRNSVIKYMGSRTHKLVAYGVASVSGTLLAVCSCTVLALFAGVYSMGAGLGPASTFLYSGPAINVLAIILTARILGTEMGIVRAVGAVLFSILIGLLMHVIFRKDARPDDQQEMKVEQLGTTRSLRRNAALFAVMVAVLVFANWARSGDVRAVFLCCPGGLTTLSVEGQVLEQTEQDVRILGIDGREHLVPRARLRALAPRNSGAVQQLVYRLRWVLVSVLLVVLLFMVRNWFTASERGDWLGRTWDFTKQILPLLLIGVLGAGFFLGRPGKEGIIPNRFVEMLVGGSPRMLLQAAGIGDGAIELLIRRLWPFWSNLFAALVGAFMYFATLTEVPILQALMGAGMEKGPALALLLAGPALSLPNMLVIHSVMGLKRTVVFVLLVVVMATLSGMLYGMMRG